MPEIMIGEADWQTVANGLSRENVMLRAQVAALARTIGEMEALNASNVGGAAKTNGRGPGSPPQGAENTDRDERESVTRLRQEAGEEEGYPEAPPQPTDGEAQAG